MRELINLLPPDAVKIVLVLLLSFFIGLEREQHQINEPHYAFGGIRTFPLIGLVSYSLAMISSPQLLPWALGFGLVGGFLLLSYHHKLVVSDAAGATTEISGLATYVVGALVYKEQYWIASTVAIFSVLLLELKLSLEGMTKHVAPREIVTFTKFLVLTVVVLPIIPNQEFTAFHLNPFKTWLVIVAVSSVSYGSYVMGLTDVDPFILGLAQTAAVTMPLRVAASAIVIAAASNNVIKAVYPYSFADRATGRRSLVLLLALAAIGLLPLVWL